MVHGAAEWAHRRSKPAGLRIIGDARQKLESSVAPVLPCPSAPDRGRCEVCYSGRLSAVLPEALRLILVDLSPTGR